MIDIKDKKDCCGCTACFNSCPKNCIKMVPDNEGFMYPHIDINQCVNCGRCEKVCPVINKRNNSFERKAYAIRDINQQNLLQSSSGSFFSNLAEYVLNNNGTVFGAIIDENHKVCHSRITSVDDINKMRGSKYIQSDLKNIFYSTKKDLCEGKLVLFSGTPCQIFGLKNFLANEYENLITIDIVCHGVSSPKLWNKYVCYMEDKYNSSIISSNFRYKTYGYHSGTMKLIFANGKIYYGSARVDYMLKSFFSEISSRPSCYSCSFKTNYRIADFTAFDCWHFEELTGKKDDDKGYTNLIINTKKGEILFDKIKDRYYYFNIDFIKSLDLDGSMYLKSAIPNSKRNLFYDFIDDLPLNQIINKYIPITKKDYFIEKLKKIYYFKKRIK